MISKEIWKDIPKFECVYVASNKGNVKRLAYTVIQYNGGTYDKPDRLLNPTVNKKTRNVSVTLNSGGYKNKYTLGRLIYELFNGVKLKRNHIIIHKDGNRLNNSVDNLKMITQRNFSAAKMKSKSGFTGVHPDKYGHYTAKIMFETTSVDLYYSDSKEECHKIYQLAKKHLELYDIEKNELLNNRMNNRLINKSVSL